MDAIFGILKHKEEQCCAGEQCISGLLSSFRTQHRAAHSREISAIKPKQLIVSLDHLGEKMQSMSSR